MAKVRGKMVDADEVGTVRLNWIQLNPERLGIPDFKKLGHGFEEWNRFIKPSELVEQETKRP